MSNLAIYQSLDMIRSLAPVLLLLALTLLNVGLIIQILNILDKKKEQGK